MTQLLSGPRRGVTPLWGSSSSIDYPELYRGAKGSAFYDRVHSTSSPAAPLPVLPRADEKQEFQTVAAREWDAWQAKEGLLKGSVLAFRAARREQALCLSAALCSLRAEHKRAVSMLREKHRKATLRVVGAVAADCSRLAKDVAARGDHDRGGGHHAVVYILGF